MKKVLIAALGIVFSGHLFAQSPSPSQSLITLGPKFALNYSSLTGDDDRLDPGRFTGVAGGAFVRLNLGRVYLQPEGYFTGKGGNLNISTQPGNAADANGKVRLTSFDVPVLLGYKLISTKVFNLRLMGGPVASFLLKENRNDLKLLDADSYTYNKSNIGFQAGVGFDIANLTFDARYEGSLNQINPTFNQRTSLFQLGVGFKIF
ncbi:MAG: PorT family protein [Ferruginibacter sp.]|nr:PorT family protein [Cytophagales bacterium]